jgi:hypothetical protein
MPSHFSRTLLKLTLLAALQAALPGAAWADDAGATQYWDEILQNLPKLPGDDAATPRQLALHDKSVSLDYDSLQQKWRASIDEYKTSNPMFSFDYGMRLSDQIAAGGRVSSQRDYSEVLVNGVYAPRSDVRLTVSGGQLRPNPDYVSQSASNGYNGLQQNSYLLDAKKYWSKDSLLSDIGVSTYLVEANGRPTSRNLAASPARGDNSDTDSVYLDTPALGKKASVVLNLGLQPTTSSRLEWRRERGRMSYYLGDEVTDKEAVMSSRFKYTHTIDNCTQLQGRYRSSDNYDRVNIGLERNNWNVSLSRTRDDGTVDTGVQFAYKIPLGGSLSSANNCKQKPDSAPSFKPLLETSTKRPDVFPNAPLLK